MVVVEEHDYYCSDSDSDDEDVDRYVFLARQPAPPAGRHAEEDDRDASSANDDDDDGEDGDGTAGGEESEGGVRKTRPLREILGDDGAPPLTKKARLELIIAAPLAARMTPPSGSESSSSRAGESGSEGSHEKAHEHRAPSPREQGEAKNAIKKKRAVCGKRSRSAPGGEADGDRDNVAAAAAKTAGASSGATAASGRFPCSLCDRCFDNHQALGGHVLGHRKRTKIAMATAAILDAEESAAAVVTEEAAKSIAQADKKDLVAARRGRANGNGSSDDEGKTIDANDAAEHGDEHVDRARHKRQRKVHGKGNGGVREPVFAGSHGDANGNGGFDNKCSPVTVSAGHGFTDGSSGSDGGKMDTGTGSPNRKVVGAGTCHDGANGNGNGNGEVCRTRYKCKVCGAECSTGRALGGHMRKHRKRPPAGGGGGGEEKSPSPATDDECQLPLAQLFRAETSLPRGYI